jgi:peptidyl-prolyl cis-trans isomerase C
MNQKRRLLLMLASMACLVLAGGHLLAQPTTDMNRPAAVVSFDNNSEIITKAQVEALVKKMASDGGQFAPLVPADRQKQLRITAAAMLIDSALWRQAMNKYMPQPQPAEIAKQMVALEDNLKRQGKTLEQFCAESVQTMTQVQNALIGVLQWCEFIKTRVTEPELQKYYAEYKDFFDHTTVDVSHILIHVSPKASQKDWQAAYKKINDIRQKVLSGKIKFADAADDSDDGETSKKGGHIGEIPRKWSCFDEAFTRAAFDPAMQPGAISGVVQSDYGYHIIQLNNRQQGRETNFESIKDEVEVNFQEDLRQQVIRQQRKLSTIHIDLEVVEALP